jgi:hypothetical protein
LLPPIITGSLNEIPLLIIFQTFKGFPPQIIFTILMGVKKTARGWAVFSKTEYEN